MRLDLAPLGELHEHGALALASDTRAAAEVAASLVAIGQRPNTERSYRTAREQWASWCSSQGADPLDVAAAPALLLVWIGALRREGLAATTIHTRIAGVVRAFRDAGLPSPAEDPKVRAARRGLLIDAAAKGETPRQARPLLVQDLRRIVSGLPDDARGQRDRLFLLIAFGAALRVDELSRLNIADLDVRDEGIIVTIGTSKTSDAATHVPIRKGRGPLCPVAAARAWLASLRAQGLTSGPLFRSIGKGGRIGAGLTTRRASDIFRDRGASAGVEGLSGHSGRLGFVQESSLAGASVQEIASVTRHRDPRMVLRYLGQAHLLRGADPLRGALALGGVS